MKSKMNIKSIVILAVISIITLFFINSSLAANVAVISVETANLRDSADSEGKILEQLSQNEEVEVLEKNGDWYKVKAKGITGYLRQDLITLKEKQDNISENTDKEVKQEEDNQSKLETQNTQEIKKDDTKKVVTADTKLKIVPAINATDIIEVKNGKEVTVIETINDWVCVQTETTKGWIRKENLKDLENNDEQKQEESSQEQTENEESNVEEKILKTLYINSDTVNLRKEANTSSDVVAKLSLNTAVDVYAEENGWSKVKVNEKEGYISSSLLSSKKQETSRSLETSRKQTKSQSVASGEQETAVPSSGKGATVVETAKRYIGCSYVYGATGPSSFDCSGFTSYVFGLHGVSLNRTAAGQYSNGVYVSRGQLQPGDLVMFGSSASNITHVGIYIGGGQIVHAANKSRGVTTDTINSGYYNNNYVGARRVM